MIFPDGSRTPPVKPGAGFEMDAILEKVDVELLYALTLSELYGIIVTFELPSRTPPANEPAGQPCARIFEKLNPSGSYTPTFVLAWGIQTMLPDGTCTPPKYNPLPHPDVTDSPAPEGVTAEN
jgi:hypothetical protein